MIVSVEHLERATLDAVAPAKLLEMEGWLLPLERSTVGRAISAVPIRHDHLLPPDVDRIEAVYAAHGLVAQFRIPDLASCQPLHAALTQKGYRAGLPVLVQARSPGLAAPVLPEPVLAEPGRVVENASGHPAPRIASQPCAAWESVYLAEGFDVVDGMHRVKALSRSQCVRYTWIEQDGLAVASGTASLSHGWLGIHGMRTLPKFRGRGLATQLVAALLQEAPQRMPEGNTLQGAYLQVEEDNVAAVRLYEKLGFRTTWRYQYWKRHGQTSPD